MKISEKLLMDSHLITSKHWGDLAEHPIFPSTDERSKALTGQGTATPLHRRQLRRTHSKSRCSSFHGYISGYLPETRPCRQAGRQAGSGE